MHTNNTFSSSSLDSLIYIFVFVYSHNTDQQATDLFNEFDTDNNGTVSLSEFLSGLLPTDYSRESWHTASQRKQSIIDIKKKEKDASKGKEAFNNGTQPLLTTSDIIHLIRSKMEMFSSKPSDQFRQITRIFGSSGDCSLPVFHSHVHKLRVYLTDDQAMKLFKHFDVDNSGTVSIVEFITGVQQHENPNVSMFSKRQQESEHKIQNKKEINRNFYRSKPKISYTRSVEEIKNIILKKIEQKCSKPTDQIRQIRRLFAQTKPNTKEGNEDGSSAKHLQFQKTGLGPNEMAEVRSASAKVAVVVVVVWTFVY